jgi:hypothetical protein
VESGYYSSYGTTIGTVVPFASICILSAGVLESI